MDGQQAEHTPGSAAGSAVGSEPKQHELFEAQTQWFHVFKTMIDSGDLAILSGSAIKVYLVVKSFTNFAMGRTFPALETIAEKSGLSLAQVKRELKTLEDRQYLTKAKVGRRNEYRLREMVEITDGAGRLAGIDRKIPIPRTLIRGPRFTGSNRKKPRQTRDVSLGLTVSTGTGASKR